jgi:ligand-binding sensor domain-containing protein
MKFKRLDTREGLSSSQVNCTFRDSRGFLWFGTAYGLNRYDGYRMKSYYSNMRDTTTMRDNYVAHIMEAWDGKLWLAQSMNYSVYDPVTERFERSASRELEKYFGFNDGVERIFIDSKKNFWVKFYEKGIYFYNPKTKKRTAFKTGYGANEINPNYSLSMMADDGDEMVFVTNDGRLLCLNGEKGVKVWEDHWMRENGAPENMDYRLSIDKFHNIWVVNEKFSFVRQYKEKHWLKLGELLQQYQIERVPENLMIRDLKIDDRGRIWCATDHEGLLVFDLRHHAMRQFLNSKFDESTISDNTLRNIYFDNDGLMWFGTYKNGVNMFKEGSRSMMNLDLGDINAVSEDNFGNYWLGTNDRGIVVYNPKTGDVLAHYTTANSPMIGNIMVGSYKASDGSIWFGGYNSGLTRCIVRNASGEATIVTYRYTGASDGLASDNVWSVTEDRWHRIWIGTLGAGIQRLDLKSGKFRTWNDKNTQLPGNYMTSASWIKKGWLMVGTSWYYCFLNPKTGELKNRVIPDDPSVPVQPGNTICVMEDSRGLIWQGSSSGVLIFDQKRKQVRLLDMQNGLFGSNVCSVTEDLSHSMWVVTDHGVSKVVPVLQSDGTWQFSVSSYNNRDGLMQGTYNQRSTCLTHDGLLLIGGQGGLDVINPKALSDVKKKERPIFSGLQLFDEDVAVGQEVDGRVILDEALNICQELTLRFNDQFTIQLGSDAGIVNNGKRFVYKLEGFNDNWVRTSEFNPNITYNSLRAGNYLLRVRMLNDDGTFGEEEATLDITIRPSLWRTRWMILLYMLLLAGVAYVWRKWYMKRQEKRMEVESVRRELEKQQWMNEMRLKMSVEQADAQQSATKREDIKLNLITEDLVFFIRNVCEHFESPDRDKTLKVGFLSSVEQLIADIDESKLKEALEILLRNSIKFTPYAPVISVGVAYTRDGMAQIQVADNGIGIKDEYKEHAFEPMINGEGIGLDRVKDIVDAHGGTIRIEDNPGGGTIFFINLPAQPEIEEAVMMDDE